MLELLVIINPSYLYIIYYLDKSFSDKISINIQRIKYLSVDVTKAELNNTSTVHILCMARSV